MESALEARSELEGLSAEGKAPAADSLTQSTDVVVGGDVEAEKAPRIKPSSA